MVMSFHLTHSTISSVDFSATYVQFNGKPAIDFFNDTAFADFRMYLDAEVKRLQRKGLGSKKRQAEPLTLEEEELLWNKGF